MVSRVRSIPRVGVLFQLHGLSVEKTADQIWADQEDERTGEPITVQPSIIPYFDYFYPCVVSEQPKIYLKDELYFSIEWGGSFLKKGQSIHFKICKFCVQVNQLIFLPVLKTL